MGKGYIDAYNAAVEAHRQRISDCNAEVNTNRAQHAIALQNRDKAVLRGDNGAAEEHKNKVLKLDDDLQFLQRDIELLGARTGVRHNPDVMQAGKAVLADNSKTMQDLHAQWITVMGQLTERKAAFMGLISQLGKIEKMALRLKAQNNDINATTGLQNAWMSTPADRIVNGVFDINLVKNEGVVFVPDKEIVQRFKFPDKFNKN